MKKIIGLGILSFLSCFVFVFLLIGRTVIFDSLEGTHLIYPMVGLTVSWIIFLSCIGFVLIRRARKKVNLWPVEKRMYSLTNTKLSITLYDLLDNGDIPITELQNNPEFLAILYEYLDYKKNGGADRALPRELIALLREVTTDISLSKKK